MRSLILFFIIILFISNSFETEQQILDDLKNKSEPIIPKNYLKHTIPPTKYGEPIHVDLTMGISVISSVNFYDLDFSLEIYFKQEWQDTRVTVPEGMFEYGEDYVNLPSQIFHDLWQPDLYFLNSKIEEKSTTAQKFSSVTLFRNKTIRFVTRMHLVVACPMKFSHYPMDTQVCPVAIESFSYNNKKMMLKWGGAGVTLNPHFTHHQYKILPIHLEKTNIYTPEKSGNFSRLIAYFSFERQIGSAVIQIFAPTTLIVMLSWFSFWLDFDAIPGRVTLLVTCLLSLVTMFTDLRVETPLVDYVKALDVWMAVCMLSVFGAITEFVIAKVLFVKYNESKNKESNNLIHHKLFPAIIGMNINMCGVVKIICGYRNKSIAIHFIDNRKEKILWQECDKLSRVVFPIIFLIFVIVYWSIMIYNREHYRRNINIAELV